MCLVDETHALRSQLPKDPKADLGMISWGLERHAEVLHLQADELKPLDLRFLRHDGRLLAVGLRVAKRRP